MLRRILTEAAVVAALTVLLIALSATVGISRSAPGPARTESGRPPGLDLYRSAAATNGIPTGRQERLREQVVPK